MAEGASAEVHVLQKPAMQKVWIRVNETIPATVARYRSPIKWATLYRPSPLRSGCLFGPYKRSNDAAFSFTKYRAGSDNRKSYLRVYLVAIRCVLTPSKYR